MTIEEAILAGISTRQFMRLEFTDDAGQPRTDVIEGYTLGYSCSMRKILKAFHWASDPGPWYFSGSRTYPIEQITTVELIGYTFGRPHDQTGARDFSEFAHIVCGYYFPA